MSTSPARLSIHGLSAILWFFTIQIALCMTILPFLSIDRNFHITPVLSLDNVRKSWDPIMLEAIANSFALSVIASLFAIACGSALIRLLSRWPKITAMTLLCIYAVNPVTRALSFGSLFTIYTPLQKMLIATTGEWFAQMILLPAVILGAHYLPIYLLRFLFVIRKETVSHTLSGILDIAFVSLPAFLRGFPISFAIFFLLTFFDYWVIQVIGGGKALYWSQMFEQKAFVARDIGQAGMLIILGLLMTVAAYTCALALCSAIRCCLRRVRPLSLAGIRTIRIPYLADTFCIALLLILGWPVLYSILRLWSILTGGMSLHLMDGAWRSIGCTMLLSGGIAVLSTLLAFLLSTLYQEFPRKCRWWMPSLYFLALVPEAAYVLYSLCVTGSGILKSSPFWLLTLMTSFTAAMSFFLWESLWGESEQRKLWLLAASMHGSASKALSIALNEWRRFFALTFIVNFWMTLDNVFITNFAAGPKWKPIAATIFTATKRGFQDAEFLTATVSSLCALLLISCIALLGRQHSEEPLL